MVKRRQRWLTVGSGKQIAVIVQCFGSPSIQALDNIITRHPPLPGRAGVTIPRVARGLRHLKCFWAFAKTTDAVFLWRTDCD